MKNRITNKRARENFAYIFRIECFANAFDSSFVPEYFNSGDFGWNYDLWDFDHFAIVDGDRIGNLGVLDAPEKAVRIIKMFRDFRLGEKWKTLSFKARERYRKQMQTRFLNEMKKAVSEIAARRWKEKAEAEEKKKKRLYRQNVRDLKYWQERSKEEPGKKVYQTLIESCEREIEKLQAEGVTA